MTTFSDRFSPEAFARLRRTARAAVIVLLATVLFGPVSSVVADTLAPPSATVNGTVYEDKNGNGQQDGAEPGVAGVSVSDGVAIVETDAQGRYQLEMDVERRLSDIVFISQPSGYKLPMDQFKTPRFYYNLGQVPEGQQRSQNFALVPDPANQGANFTFANIADPHVNPQLPEQIHEINSTANGTGFITVSGDLTNSATDAEFNFYKNATAGSNLPVWPAVGNHEYFSGGGTTYAARIDNYRRHVGPEWYSFDYGNRHFLILENNGQAPFAEQLDWVRRDLAANVGEKELVVIAHQPMNVPFGSPSQYDEYGDLFTEFGAELMLVGHEHSNDAEPDSTFAPTAKHVQTVSASYTIDSAPRGFRYVHMRGDEFENPFKLFGVEKSITITSPAPGSVVSGEGHRTGFPDIQVNAYDTGDEIIKVRYRIDGGSWRSLKSSGEITWHSDFIGRAPAPGEHTIEVEAASEAGESWKESATFTLTDEAAEAPQPGADWSQHHGSADHAGVATDVVGPAMSLAWSYRTDGTFLTGSPVIVDGVVYAGTRDENGEGNAAVHAVDMVTGEKLWEYTVPSSVIGSPAVLGDTVFAGTLRGTLFAIDRETGELNWKRETEPGQAPFNQRAYSYYAPTVADGKVFWTYQTRYGPASQGLLTALNPENGDTIWASPMTGSTMSDGTPAVLGDQIFVGSNTADQVVAYNVDTGARQWTSSAVLGGWQDGVPSAADGRVFIGSNNGIIARNAATGADLWSYRSSAGSLVSSGSTPSAAAIADGIVYMGFPSGAVTALDAVTGSVLWERVMPGTIYTGGIHSSPVVSGDTLFVGANNGWLYALDRTTGQPLWQYEIGNWVASGPAISGNTLITGAWDGNLYAFTPGGEAAERWARVMGTVTDGVTGETIAGARVVATRAGANPVTTTTDSQGRYVLGLSAGTYTVATAKRAFLGSGDSSGSVTVGSTGDHTLDLELVEVTEPIAGTSNIAPDFGSGSPRVDAVAGETYHYTMNNRVQANISSRATTNNLPGTFVPGSLADLALLDGTAQETLDWSELILAPVADDPARPWGRTGEWLNMSGIGLDGDAVVTTGSAQVNPALHTSLRYRTLPDAPVVKVTLEIENTGAADWDGYFQYLLDPDSPEDVAYIPGVAGTNPGYRTSGWSDNFVYTGPTTVRQSPAHAVAWLENDPVGVAAYGYIAGPWFDASVDAGGTRTISWYHITDYPGAGHPTSNVATWVSKLDVLDDEVADRSRIAGTVTGAGTGAPLSGVQVEALNAAGDPVASTRTTATGDYTLAIDPGTYTVRASALGYTTGSTTVELAEGATVDADLALQPVTVSASTGKTLNGGIIEGDGDDIVIENSKLAMAVSRFHDDGQLPGSTIGKPIDLAVQGRADQLDWINLPYIVNQQPTGTEAWQKTTVRNTNVEIVQATGEQAVVRTTGTSSEHPGVNVATTYTVRPNEEWITAASVFTNTGTTDLTVWVGDAIDWDGAGQRIGVPGHGVITTPYESPAEYLPTGRWIGATGTDPQTYGLIYEGDDAFSAYGNGNWVMSRFQVEIPAGESYTLDRRIVAASNAGATNPFAILDTLAGQ